MVKRASAPGSRACLETSATIRLSARPGALGSDGRRSRVAISASLLRRPCFKPVVAFQRLKNVTERTVEEHGKILSALFAHIGPGVVAPEQTTADHFRDYIAGLQQRGLAPETVADRVVVIRRFFGFLLPVGRLD